MKKLLLFLLTLLPLAAFSGPLQSISLLNQVAVQVTNSVGITNILTWNNGTNFTGIYYTNKFGKLLNTTNAVTVTNYAGSISTNFDTTLFLRDAQVYSDAIGNPNTNYFLSFAYTCNATTTGAVLLAFAPIYRGPFDAPSFGGIVSSLYGNSTGSSFLNYAQPMTEVGTNVALTTIVLPVPNPGTATFVTTNSILPLALGQAGWRLMTAVVTNTAGSVWLQDISQNGFWP